MKKKVSIIYDGITTQVGTTEVVRLLPNHYIQAVGPFVFLDNIPKHIHLPKTPTKPDGSFAHPHRGIATFSYMIYGELEHYDSQGNYGVIGNGGLQWMKAGNGIIHDENPTLAFQKTGGIGQGMQFWINLPAQNKRETPDYMAVQGNEVPEVQLPNQAGSLRVLIGEFATKSSIIPTYSKQFLYHIQLTASASFLMKTEINFEYAAFAVSGNPTINEVLAPSGQLAVFDSNGDEILFENPTSEMVDIMVFGGETYTESIVAQGPYVMNTFEEILEANNDYFKGKYGKINYSLNS
ncbi:MAG: pirin family protein [Limnohabitans sp.]|nr:pirin family protein [Limnohabitans sp.]